jgi:drug/metabolite transporter (DMT)-like permease
MAPHQHQHQLLYQNDNMVGKPSFLSVDSYGIVLLAVSALLYSVMGVFIKLSVDVPSMDLVFFRGIVQGSVVVAAMCFLIEEGTSSRLIQHPFGAERVRPVVIARGMVGGFGFVLHYFTIKVLPLGDATALLSLSPIITVVASAIFLNEPFHVSVFGAALGSVIGSILIAKPNFIFGGETVSSPGYISGPLGSCCAAAVVMLVRKAGKTGVHTLQLLFSWCFFGILYSAIANLVLHSFSWPTSTESWWYVGWMIFFGIGAHFLMNYAGRFAPASLTSIIRSTSIMWAYAWEILGFGHMPEWTSLLGAFIILLSVIVVTSQQHLRQQEERRVEETNQLLLSQNESEIEKDQYGSIVGNA